MILLRHRAAMISAIIAIIGVMPGRAQPGATPGTGHTPDAREVMAITHFGGPDFTIRIGSNVVYVDPLTPNAPNFIRHFKAFRKSNDPPADLVLITHAHRDHCDAKNIGQLAQVNGQLLVIAPVDARDTLEEVLQPGQLVTPVPLPGQPREITRDGVTVRVYRTLHGWYTDDASPYTLTSPYHYSYLVEAGGRRVFISGDSYDDQEVARDVSRIDAIVWHIYKPSDVYQFQRLQSEFSPAMILPYHLNIRYGLQQPEMAALTDRFRFQDVNAVYLTEGNNTVTIDRTGNIVDPEARPNAAAPVSADTPEPSSPGADGLSFSVESDTLFRGIPERNTARLVALVRNRSASALAGTVDLQTPPGWTAEAVDPIAFARLTRGHDFICRFKIRAPNDAVLDGACEYPVTGTLTLKQGGQPSEVTSRLELGGGNLYAWNVLGPLELDDDSAPADTHFSPLETGIDLRETYTGRDGTPIRWTPYTSRDLHAGFIDLAGIFDMRETLPAFSRWQERLVGYAVCYVESPTAREVMLQAGAPYGLHIFINADPVFQMTGFAFNFFPGQFQIPAQLHKGRNQILVKIVRNQLADWNLSPWIGFCLRVTDTRGLPFDDLKFSRE